MSTPESPHITATVTQDYDGDFVATIAFDDSPVKTIVRKTRSGLNDAVKTWVEAYRNRPASAPETMEL